VKDAYRALQGALLGLGYDPGPVDGAWGPKTRAAVNALATADGAPRGVTHIPSHQVAQAGNMTGLDDLPWMQVARAHLGLHEGRDNKVLRAFLEMDGATLGDPSKLPWCGDFVETCIKVGLPYETFTGNLKANRYWARNWLEFGLVSVPTYGAVVIFERGPSSGHVGFLVGQDAECFYVLGGNQSDTVTIARIASKRALGYRWPATSPARAARLPQMQPGQTVITSNEA
jgi:uncharacterized protein (TIGR02594 family)